MSKRIGKRVIFTVLLAVVFVLANTICVLAETDDSNTPSLSEIGNAVSECGLMLDLTEFENDDILYYGVKNDDNTISLTTDPNAKGNAVFVGGLNKDSWNGSTINFTISVRAIGTKLYAHAGTIYIHKVNSSGGIGSLYNSMTFAITSSTPKSKLSKSHSMNTGSLNKIYIKLMYLTVTDSDGDVTALSPTQKKFVK